MAKKRRGKGRMRVVAETQRVRFGLRVSVPHGARWAEQEGGEGDWFARTWCFVDELAAAPWRAHELLARIAACGGGMDAFVGGFLFDVNGAPWGYDAGEEGVCLTTDYLDYAAVWFDALEAVALRGGRSARQELSIYGQRFLLQRSGSGEVILSCGAHVMAPGEEAPEGAPPVVLRLGPLVLALCAQLSRYGRVVEAFEEAARVSQWPKARGDVQRYMRAWYAPLVPRIEALEERARRGMFGAV